MGKEKHGGGSEKPAKVIYDLVTSNFDDKKVKNALSVQRGDVVVQVGKEGDSDWAFVEKVSADSGGKGKDAKGKAANGKDAKVEAGYVPVWVISEIPKNNGKDTATAVAKKKEEKSK